MATIIVQSTQSAKDQVISDFPTGDYNAEDFNKTLQEQGISTSGMSISVQDLANVEDVISVRDSNGNWGDEYVFVNDDSTFIVGLNPKSTSNG